MATLTAKHRPYPAYKPSGVEWLGDVPAHWEVAAVKRYFSIQLGKMLQNTPNSPADIEVPYLKAQHVQWFQVLTADVPTMWANQNEKHKFGIKPGDLLVCEGGEGGRCAIVRQQINNCIIQNALHRVRPHRQSLNAFLQYVMNTVTAVGWFDVLNNKATIAHFTKEKFDALKIVSPPLPEQRAIAAFLDRETGKIDALISKKERLVELLQEKRTALISHTVTKGLDPNAPLKNSGVEWLGEIPAHWEVRRLKYLATVNDEKLPENTDPNTEITYVDIGNVDSVKGITGTEDLVFENAPSRARRVVRQGDVIISTVRTYLKAIARIESTNAALIVSTGFAVIRPRHLDDGFVAYALGSPYFVERVVAHSVGVSYPAINASELACLDIAFPTVPEQAAIAAFLDRETAELDSLIAKVHDAIELLKELRTALISAAVTGRIDVREETECT